jgi:alpha-galactosidase
VGGGSTHWTPSLVVDFANTACLHDAQVTLADISAESLPPMVKLVEHIAEQRKIGMQVSATTDLARALDGAEFVIAAFSVGGFASMEHDIEIPARYGLRQPVGDSVGPGGIFRALRSVPVFVDMARQVAASCPDALLINVTNPLTALCRAASVETGVKVVGLCNELVGLLFSLSLLFDAPMHEIVPVVGGVNHLPLVTGLTVKGDDGFELLRQMLNDPGDRLDKPIWMQPVPAGMHWRKVSEGEKWTKADVLFNNRLKLALFEQFGVLPGSADTHVSEFFGGFVTEASDFGREWGVHHYGMAGHKADKDADDAKVADLMAADEIPVWPSGELVANLLEGMVTGEERALPVNLPNTGQVTNLDEGSVVECIGLSGADGVRARDKVTVPGPLGEHVRRVAASQEMTVGAALRGTRTDVLGALLNDPFTSRLPFEQMIAMADELFTATAAWLPQFA